MGTVIDSLSDRLFSWHHNNTTREAVAKKSETWALILTLSQVTYSLETQCSTCKGEGLRMIISKVLTILNIL